MGEHSTWRTFLSRAVCWTLIGAVAGLVTVAIVVPRLGGGTPYVLLSGSMRPALGPGTLVVARPVGTELPGLGTVITYQRASGDPTVVTHRVVAQGISAVGEPVVRTRGDANAVVDPGWIRPIQIRGELWYDVPYAGYVVSVVPPQVRAVLLPLAVALLALYSLAMFAAAVRERRLVPGAVR